jgi:hypothetical protein
MIKFLVAPAVFGLLGMVAVAWPGFAPRLEASETVGETVVLAKGDALHIRPAARKCAQQVWPNYDASCLRSRDAGTMICEARLVAARR